MNKAPIIASNIQWDYDFDEIYEKLDSMSAENAAEALGISYERYANMTTEERHDYAYDLFHHCPGAACEFLGLPNEIEIPAELTDEEDISDWLSDEYGYCHKGFALSTDT